MRSLCSWSSKKAPSPPTPGKDEPLLSGVFSSLWPVGLLGLLVCGAYLKTLAPGLTWANGGADGGDLITAVVTGGVPHPSGYPTFLLLAEIFRHLPLGTLAFRMNLMSTVFGVYTVVALYFFLEKHLKAQPAALIATLAFAFSPLFWSQAVIAEVYTLHLAFVITLLGMGYYFPNTAWHHFLLGLSFGLGLGNHLTLLLLLPLLAICREGDEVKCGSRLPSFDQAVSLRLLGLLVGISVYAILPLRALKDPPVNWENPATLSGFVRLVSGQIYAAQLGHLVPADLYQRLRGLSGLLFHQFSALGVFLGLYGLLGPFPPYLRGLTAWIFVTSSLFALFYALPDSFVYLLPAFLSFAIWIGVGVREALLQIGRYHCSLRIAFSVVLLLGSLLRAGWLLPEVDASRDHRAENFGKTVLALAPPNAILLVDEDQEVFALWYYHYALNARPDVKIVVEGLLPFEWYQQVLRSIYPDLVIFSESAYNKKALFQINPSFPHCVVDWKHPELRFLLYCSP